MFVSFIVNTTSLELIVALNISSELAPDPIAQLGILDWEEGTSVFWLQDIKTVPITHNNNIKEILFFKIPPSLPKLYLKKKRIQTPNV